MSSRHLSRSIVLQTLFEWDFNKEEDRDINIIMKYNVENFAMGLKDTGFIQGLLNGIFIKIKELDKVIEISAPEWPLEQIAIIDRNVLRIGLYELLYGDYTEVPPKVAINEAIELAKTFGGETSGKFVNGVLGTVYKELEGGSEFKIKPGYFKNKKTEKGYEKVKEEISRKEILGGAVVYKKEGNNLKLALVHDIFGYWTLSKGRLEENENLEIGIKREIKEELGIEIELKENLGVNDYIASHPELGKVLKSVTYFLAEAKSEDLRLGTSGGLDEAKWFYLDEIPKLNIYNDILPFLTKAIKILSNR